MGQRRLPQYDVVVFAFGRAITQAREDAGLTRQDLADAIGVHVNTVARTERGVLNPTLRSSMRLAEGVGVPLSKLIQAAEKDAKTLRRRPNGLKPS